VLQTVTMNPVSEEVSCSFGLHIWHHMASRSYCGKGQAVIYNNTSCRLACDINGEDGVMVIVVRQLDVM
jgi:hypothetical protein